MALHQKYRKNRNTLDSLKCLFSKRLNCTTVSPLVSVKVGDPLGLIITVVATHDELTEVDIMSGLVMFQHEASASKYSFTICALHK